MYKFITLLLFMALVALDADFIRDNAKEAVIDTSAKLMWQDNNESKYVAKNWQDAIQYCEDLTLNSYNDWRLPNRNELFSIGDKTKVNPAIKSAFLNIKNDTYWSSTSRVDNAVIFPSTIEFTDANDNEDDSVHTHYVRCVRDVNESCQ